MARQNCVLFRGEVATFVDFLHSFFGFHYGGENFLACCAFDFLAETSKVKIILIVNLQVLKRYKDIRLGASFAIANEIIVLKELLSLLLFLSVKSSIVAVEELLILFDRATHCYDHFVVGTETMNVRRTRVIK